MASYMSWSFKGEPESPYSVLEGSEDVWLFDDNEQRSDDGSEDGCQLSEPTPTLTRAQHVAQLLDDLECSKDDTFPDWLEEKVDLPIFEHIPTETLLQEFNSVCNAVELSNGALTPPQSPPYYNGDHSYHQFAEQSFYHAVPEKPFQPNIVPPNIVQRSFIQPSFSQPNIAQLNTVQPNIVQTNIVQSNTVQPNIVQSNVVLADPLSQCFPKQGYTVTYVDDMILLDQLPQATPQPDLDMELAVVDELVRSRAEGMDVSQDPWETSAASSPVQFISPPESSNDSFGSDSEWVPETVNTPKAVAPKRKRGKPYERPVEDKKIRKKEQNKSAATRYRQKKKEEVDLIVGEEKELEDKNAGLHEKVKNLQQEIKYLKGLMRDMFKAKGLLKN